MNCMKWCVDYIDENINELKYTLIELFKNVDKILNESYDNFIDSQILDQQLNTLISKKIIEFLDIPVISRVSTFYERSNIYWLINPINTNSINHTVNISLIYGDSPYIGCIYIPNKQHMYFVKRFSLPEYISIITNYKLELYSHLQKIENKKLNIVVNNRFKYQKRINMFNNPDIIYSNNILAILLIICNKKDMVFNQNEQCEWDVAPLDIILNEAGGRVRDLDGNLLKYNSEKFKVKNVWACCKF